jgi:hypothetical protein
MLGDHSALDMLALDRFLRQGAFGLVHAPIDLTVRLRDSQIDKIPYGFRRAIPENVDSTFVRVPLGTNPSLGEGFCPERSSGSAAHRFALGQRFRIPLERRIRSRKAI